MMSEVVPAVRQLLPGLLSQSRPTVACVCTTRPKYLVFDRDPDRPACIVEFGAADRLLRTDRILSEISARMPLSVPASLCCSSWRNGTYVHVQQGLGGVPWFRVADRMAGASAWRSLLERAATAMLDLHAATRQVAAWQGNLHAGAELRSQAALCERNGYPLSPALRGRIKTWSASIDAAGLRHGCWQHGDFSINNLLVAPASLAIIDFEEFGGTLVPLHDAFGLALSVHLSQHGCPLSLQDCIRPVIARARIDEAVETDDLPGLLMHHLLWRLNQCHGLERRAALGLALLEWAHTLASDPRQFFGAPEWLTQ
jgi:hypothetical protein